MSGIDLRLFHWLNGRAVHPWLDVAMPILTSRQVWGVVLVGLIAWLIARGARRGRLAALSLVLALALGDVTASQLFKPAFARPRPCHAGQTTRLLVRCGGRNGFPSNHAVNAASVCSALGSFFPASLPITVPLAVAVGWSRVYVGVHYPADVVAGWGWGGVVGLGVAAGIRRIFRRRLSDPAASDNFNEHGV